MGHRRRPSGYRGPRNHQASPRPSCMLTITLSSKVCERGRWACGVVRQVCHAAPKCGKRSAARVAHAGPTGGPPRACKSNEGAESGWVQAGRSVRRRALGRRVARPAARRWWIGWARHRARTAASRWPRLSRGGTARAAGLQLQGWWARAEFIRDEPYSASKRGRTRSGRGQASAGQRGVGYEQRKTRTCAKYVCQQTCRPCSIKEAGRGPGCTRQSGDEAAAAAAACEERNAA
jgi:hypothetical protein